ncbi:MAG: ATP-binding protein [Armatimonadetes bacterium]|nr:ATP-binding protein [Armatimonadota bacterium]
MPIPQNADYARLKELVSAIIEKQKTEPRYSYYQHEQKEIDALVYQLYRLDENDIREVEIWFCRRYALLAKAQGVWAEVETKYADYFERAKLILEKPPGYWHSHPVYTLIAEGEGHKLDFKCYLAVDIDGRASSKSVESVVSEIAAFLNTNGGTLLIGVEDSGVVTGIEKDLPLVNKKNNDGFEQKLRQSVEAALSPNPSGIKVAFEPLPEGVVCRVEVPPQLGVTYYKGKGDLPDKVYIRDGNRSIALEGRNLVDWTLRRRG